MPAMSAFDHSDLDGRLLQLLLAVVEERSVTRAAERLGVTQSAVSHLLDKLRAIVGDPLIVKAGRGIVPTARAEALAVRARVLLEDLRGFATPEGFDPDAADHLHHRRQRPAVRPAAAAAAAPAARAGAGRGAARHSVGRAAARDAAQRRLPAGDQPAPARRRRPAAAPAVRRPLPVFFDAIVAPGAASDLDDYLAAEHVTVVYEPRRSLDIDRILADALKLQRRFVASVPGFSGIRPSCAAARCWPRCRGCCGWNCCVASAMPALPCRRARDADVHGVARAPAERPGAPLAARRIAGGGAACGWWRARSGAAARPPRSRCRRPAARAAHAAGSGHMFSSAASIHSKHCTGQHGGACRHCAP
jgi:DNA-binding transcriptional ArsR family regulator